MPGRLRRVHARTPEPAVVKALGLDQYQGIVTAGGSDNHYGEVYYLDPPDFEIILYFDRTKEPAEFIEGSLVGVGWQRIAQ